MKEKSKSNVVFRFDSFTITRQEIFASVSIVAVLLLIGMFISNKISEHQMDLNEKYNKTVKIETQELFEYGMQTNVGYAFVYGELSAVDPVTYSELDAKYMYVKKIEERHTKHTKQVRHTKTVNGKTQTYYTTEEYWTWDKVDSESLKCNQVLFQGVCFPTHKIQIPGEKFITTIQKSSKTRYQYYGVDTRFVGTIFTELKDNTISDNSPFYNGSNIEGTIEGLESNCSTIIFWIAWGIFIVICVFVFYFIDNRWLE